MLPYPGVSTNSIFFKKSLSKYILTSFKNIAFLLSATESLNSLISILSVLPNKL